MFGIGMQEIAVILVVALIFIGPKRLPEVARTLGKAMGEIRRATDDFKSSMMVDVRDTTPRDRNPPNVKAPAALPAAAQGTPGSQADPTADVVRSDVDVDDAVEMPRVTVHHSNPISRGGSAQSVSDTPQGNPSVSSASEASQPTGTSDGVEG